jgi:hypothetical protein
MIPALPSQKNPDLERFSLQRTGLSGLAHQCHFQHTGF